MKDDKNNQIILIGGGETFPDTEHFYQFLRDCKIDYNQSHKSWREWIAWALSDTWDVFTPRMPNKLFADYVAWKIWFEKLLPTLNDQKLVLVGHSLGGTFLAKCLSEEPFPKKVAQLHLVAPVFDNEGLPDGEELGNFVFNSNDLKNIPPHVGQMYLYHSTDDEVVPHAHAEKFKQALPDIELVTFSNRGHFLQPAFPELLSKIQQL